MNFFSFFLAVTEQEVQQLHANTSIVSREGNRGGREGPLFPETPACVWVCVRVCERILQQQQEGLRCKECAFVYKQFSPLSVLVEGAPGDFILLFFCWSKHKTETVKLL